jgi:hypothetical protein
VALMRQARGAAGRLRSITDGHRRTRNTVTVSGHLPLVNAWLGEMGRPSSGWIVDSIADTRTATAVAMLAHPQTGERLVIRVARGSEGVGLERGSMASQAVRVALGDRTPFMVATPLALRHTHHDVLSVETRLPGAPISETGLDLFRASEVVAQAITHLHRSTASRSLVAPEQAVEICGRKEGSVRVPGITRRLERVADWACAELMRSERLLARTHGDLNLSNALFSPGEPVGVALVDWDTSLGRGLPALDGISLVMDVRQRESGSETGTVVRSVIEDGYTDREKGFLSAFDEQAVDPLMTWLWWVSFVNHSMETSARLRSHPYWLHYNVGQVLGIFDSTGAVGR